MDKPQQQRQKQSKSKSARKKSNKLEEQSTSKQDKNFKLKLADRTRNKMHKQAIKKRSKPNNNQGCTLQIDKYQIDLESVLGKGTFGQVYKANLIDRPDQVYACKLISKSKLQKQKIYQENSNGRTILQRLQAQIQTQKKLSDCKFVVKLYDFIKIQSEGYYLFMEMCDTDLGQLIKSKIRLQENQSLQLFKQLLKGYKYLYDHGVSHRDLKPENLLILGKNLKIADFGLVKVHSAAEVVLRSAQKGLCLAQSLVGSINYISPDILLAQKQKKKYDPFKSDVWSMGIILYKMIYGKQPYQAVQTNKLLQLIQKQPLKLPDSPSISSNLARWLSLMIQKDQNKRIKFKELYNEIIKQDDNNIQDSKLPSVIYSQKQRLLLFYNMIMTKISYDSAHHATLRQLGILQYQKYSSRIMTLIHQKRLHILKSLIRDTKEKNKEKQNEKDKEKDKDKQQRQVNQQIRKQIMNYNENFYQPIKLNCQHQSQRNSQKMSTDLATELQKFRDYLKKYEQFQMLHQSVQYFILLLLLLYNFQRGFVSTDYILTIVDKQKNNKLNFKKLEEITKKNLNYN